MRTITVFVAVIPCDYTSADVEVFETKEEAEQYIEEHAIRGDKHYCLVMERKVVTE